MDGYKHKSNIEDVYPMSDIQKGMVYFTLKDPVNSPYIVEKIYHFKNEDFDAEVLQKAFSLMVTKHSILRSTFNMYDFEEPLQIVYKEVPWDIEKHDISYLGKEARVEYINKLLGKDRQDSFDITANNSTPELLWRLKLVSADEENIYLLWTVHHAIIDGWSNASLIAELNHTYLKLKSDPTFIPQKMKSTYKDYVVEQIREKKRKENYDFWRKELEDYKRLKFPETQKNNTASKMSKIYIRDLGISLLEKLRNVATKYNSSVKNLCFGAYFYMLSMLSYEKDIVVGLTSNNRPACEDGDRIIGCFLTTTTVRMKIPANIKWLDYIRMVEKKLLELKRYDRLPFPEIARITGEETQDQTPICDTLFNFVDFYISNEVIPGDKPGDSSEARIVEDGIKKIKLFNFVLNATGGSLKIHLSYDNSMLSDELAISSCGYFEGVLNKFIYEAEQIIRKEELLPAEEKQKLLYDFNNTVVGLTAGSRYPLGRTIQAIFEEQVEKMSDNAAVVYEDKLLTYAELNKRSNQLARCLRAKGIGPEGIVGLIVERSVEMMIGIMAVFKSGGAYLPVEPGYPAARKKFLLEECQPKVLLAQGNLIDEYKDLLEEGAAVQIISIDDETIYTGGSSNIKSINKSSDLAYVIYTSGTTGKPNGIMGEHRKVINYVYGLEERIFRRYGKKLNFSLVAPYVFDGSFRVIFGALLHEHSLFIMPEETRIDGKRLIEFYGKNKIDISDGAPAHIRLMAESIKGNTSGFVVKNFIIAGEILPKRVVKAFLDNFETNAPEITNAYGPTECCGISTIYNISKENVGSFESFPIGTPLPNEQVYIVDRDIKLQPIGVFGELCISGDSVTRGYLKREKLTYEKFTANPFDKKKRLYRTGDLARWLPDGNLDFLGRIDSQVKIRGFRIELGEIENTLLNFNGIKSVVVRAREMTRQDADTDTTEDKYLCAYFSAEEKIELSELREYLTRILPKYMMPSFFVQLEKMPLTTSGKVDVKMLPDPEIGETGDNYTAPRNEVEEKMVEIWAGILGIEKTRISINASFFELGGHSLNATVLMAKIHKAFNVKLPLTEVFRTPTAAEMSEYVKRAARDTHTSIPVAEKKECYPLSSAQKRLYILQQMKPGNLSYNMPKVIELAEGLELDKLEQAFGKLIERHESLRTSFEMIGEVPVQKIHDNVDFDIEYHDKVAVVHRVIDDFVRFFDLSQSPLFRVGLIKTDEGRNFLLVDMHHIISDGISRGLLGQDFMTLYRGEELPFLRLQYKDYSGWQNSEIHKTSVKHQEAFWLKKFEGEVPVLEMPIDYVRPAVTSSDGNTLNFSLEGVETGGLNKLALEEEVTLYMVLLAIYNILLSKLTGQEDIVIGTPIAGRSHVDLERIIGMFINTLALRNSPAGEKTFTGFLQEIKQKTLQAFENQEYPLEDLLDKLGLNRDVSHHPLFDVVFGLQNFGEGKRPEPENEGDEYENKTSKFDISLRGMEVGDSLNFKFTYCTKLFKEETIKRFIGYFKRIASIVPLEPGIKISEIEILPEEEKQQVLFDFNNTEAGYPRDKTIHQLFQEQAEKTRNHIAVVFNDKRITYGELEKSANRLTGLFRIRGVNHDSVVGIMVERSVEMIIGILGILKAGGAYLPIDPQSPVKRIDYMLADSSADILLSGSSELSKASGWEGETILLSEGIGASSYSRPAGDTVRPVRPDSRKPSAALAYVIYTSGTRGTPKGVMIEHRSVVNLVVRLRETVYTRKTPVNVALVSPFFFDASIKQVFPTLLLGNTLVVMPEEARLDSEKLVALFKENGIWASDGTPAHLSILLNYKERLSGDFPVECFLIGGEELKTTLCEQFINAVNKESFKVINVYGPTECCDVTSLYSVDRETVGLHHLIPIGKPLGNMKTYILGRGGEIQPIGVAGELCIGGHGCGRGYLNQPELTAERFSGAGGLAPLSIPGKLYETGDLARWLPDGNILFQERIDHQVKLRGYRIELGEIENQLLKHDEIKEAAVLSIGDDAGGKYLYGYIVPNGMQGARSKEQGEVVPAVAGAELREFLSQTLPDYMIPSHFVWLEKLPLTPNGKLDRKTLPEPEIDITGKYVGPRNYIEEKLVEIWSEVLKIEKEALLGIKKNFFEVGGHSLNAVIMISKIHKELNVKVPLAEIFKTPTIMRLSDFIKEASEERYASIEPVEKKGYYALSSAQKRLLILQKMDLNSIAYNMPKIIPLPGEPDVEKLEETFIKLINRHESLRTSFHMVGEDPVQWIHDTLEFEIGYYDISEVEAEVKVEEKSTRPVHRTLRPANIIEHFICPFDLTHAPLLRVALIRTGTGEHLLMIDMHHIICDGVSRMVLEQDFMALYEGEELPPLRIQYKDFSEWQNRLLETKSETMRAQEAYWLKEFEGEITALTFPIDYDRPTVKSFEGNMVSFEIPGDSVNVLRSIALENGATIFMVFIAIYYIFLSKISSQGDIVVGTPIAGRNHTDLEQVIGMFVNTLALRSCPKGEETFKEFLANVKEKTLEALKNQDYQFEYLVEKLAIERDISRNPLFDVVFTLREIDGGPSDKSMEKKSEEIISTFEIAQYQFEKRTSKFDLSLNARVGERTFLIFEYSTKLFKQETIESFADYFKEIVSIIVRNKDIRLKDIQITCNLLDSESVISVKELANIEF